MRPIFASVLLFVACTETYVSDVGYNDLDCTETVVETLGRSDPSAHLGFSADDLAAAMTAVALGDAAVRDTDATLPVDLITTAAVLGDASVVDAAGDDGCLQGRLLRARVRITTAGTLGGWDVLAEKDLEVAAAEPTFNDIWSADGYDYTSKPHHIELPPELAEHIRDLWAHRTTVAPASQWSGWWLGPSANLRTPWSELTASSALGATYPDGDVRVVGDIVAFTAVAP